MYLKALTNCPVCFRIQFEIVLLVFQTTPSLLGLLSSLSPGDGVCPFPSLCLFSVLPTNSLLLSQELSSVIVSHPELTPCTCPTVLHFTAKFHSNDVFFRLEFNYPFPSVLTECITLGHTKHSEALGEFLLWFLQGIAQAPQNRLVKTVMFLKKLFEM